MGFIFKEPDNKPVDPKVARTRAILLSLPFAVMGIFALVLLLHDGLGGGLDRQHAMGLLSAAIVCCGIITLIFGVNAKKQALQAGVSKIDDEKPWLSRKDWSNGRLATSARKSILLLWIFVAFWCAVSVVISLAVVPPQLQAGNHAALFVLLLPVISLAIVVFALNTTRAWRKFNRSIFQMTAFPAPAGSVLAGEIRVQIRLRPLHGLHLRLSCVRRTTTGTSFGRRTSEKILWQDEKWLRADLPQTGFNATGIPVFFKLPANLPESTVSTGDGIHWKLEASAELAGPNFHAAFDVPVFKLSEISAPSDDPTGPYQLSLDEIRRQIRSPILVKDLPAGGKEFIFPAARNPGFASGASIICLIWSAIIVVLIWKHAPLPLILLFGAMDLLMAAFVGDLWLRRSRVTVNPGGLTVQRAWLGFKTEQRLPAGEIRSFVSDVGAAAGHVHYHELKVLARDGKEFVLAKHLNSKPESDWLIRQMIAAMKAPA